MSKFKGGDIVVFVTNEFRDIGLKNTINELTLGKSYTVAEYGVGRYDFSTGNLEDAIDLEEGYRGWYPAALFVPAHEYKESLIGDNIYEIY